MTVATLESTPATRPGAMPALRVICDPQEWEQIELQWADLFDASPTASPPLRFEWLRHWWRVYGPAYSRADGLRIFTVWRDRTLIGALPLYVHTAGKGAMGYRRLCFLSSGEAESEETCAEYLDLLHLPGEQQTCLDLIRQAVFNNASRAWHELDLRDMSDQSPCLELQHRMSGEAQIIVTPRGVCPIADISGGLDRYLARLSANTRQQSRRILRAAARAGAQFEVAADLQTAREFYAQLIELHQARWKSTGAAGCFAASRFTEFHRALVDEWASGGKAILSRLSFNGEPAAVVYGFAVRRKFDFYQSGVAISPNRAVSSPGIVAFLMLMDHLSTRGITQFDFLRGECSYKDRLSTHRRALLRLQIVQPTLRTRMQIASDFIGRASRTLGRQFASEPRGQGAARRQASANGSPRPARGVSKTKLAAGLLEASGLGTILRNVGSWKGVLSLAYHRIGDSTHSPFDHGLFSATPEAFDAQVTLLKKHFDVVGPQDLPAVVSRARGRCVLITFDDGYRDNYEQAFPILRSHGVSATFFVSTGFVDSPRASWWDDIAWMVRTSRHRHIPASDWLPSGLPLDRELSVRAMLAAYRAVPVAGQEAFLNDLAQATGSGRCNEPALSRMWMTWDMLREMKAAGMSIGGHTDGHPILANLDRESQRNEIASCRERIAAELGQPMKWFSYPRGKPDAFNEDTRACLCEEGVELAFSYYGGFRRFDEWDPYDVRRAPVEMDTSRTGFRALVTLPQVFL